MICPHCGRDSDPLFKFCLHCGKELGAIKKAKKPAAPKPAAPEAREPQPASEPAPPPQAARTPTPEPAQARCPRCRAKVNPEATQCRLCGADFGEHGPPSERAEDRREPAVDMDALQSAPGYIVSVSSVDGRESVKLPLRKGRNTLGRGDQTDLSFPEDDLLSPVQLTIELDEKEARLVTNGSRNGTFLRMADQVRLAHGDLFRIGQQLLRFEQLERLAPVIPDKEEGTQILGSPGGPRAWGRLTQVINEEQTGSSFLLTSENVFLGRERGNITFPGDRYISGTHAVVTRKDDGAWLRDVGSSNGTYLRITQTVPLTSGQYFLAGRQLFKLFLNR